MNVIKGIEFFAIIPLSMKSRLTYDYRAMISLTPHSEAFKTSPRVIATHLSFSTQRAASDQLNFLQKPEREFQHQVTGAQAAFIMEAIRRFSKDLLAQRAQHTGPEVLR